MTASAPKFFWALLIIMLALQVAVWSSVRDVRGRWTNVPPVPGLAGVSIMALGDREFAYRSAGLTLQNLGSVGGRTEALRSYDYSRLKEWFLLSLQLDRKSNFMPYLAAYYFGAADDPEKLRHVVEYLQIAGRGDEERRWRWLAQAVYIARFQVRDMDLAYDLANELAALDDPTLPVWAKQMPAFVLAAKGDKQGAYDMLVGMLKTDAGKLPAEEINAMRAYICRSTLTPEEAKTNALCEDLK